MILSLCYVAATEEVNRSNCTSSTRSDTLPDYNITSGSGNSRTVCVNTDQIASGKTASTYFNNYTPSNYNSSSLT
jgi:hypothetical protein